MRSGDISGRSGRYTWEVETFMAEAGEMHEKWRHLWQKRERHMWSGDISGRSMRSRDIYGRSRRHPWQKWEKHMWSWDISGRSMRSRDISGRNGRYTWEVETCLYNIPGITDMPFYGGCGSVIILLSSFPVHFVAVKIPVMKPTIRGL
jgi:hypothetical protein